MSAETKVVENSDPNANKSCTCQGASANSDPQKEETMPDEVTPPIDPAVTPPVTPPATTPPVEPVKEPDKPAETPKPLTEDEEIEALKSESLRQMVKKYRAQETKEREQLIAQLGKRQKAFTVKELERKPTEELEKLVQLAGGDEQNDYSGRVLVSGDDDEDEPKEGVWSKALRKQREKNLGQQAN